LVAALASWLNVRAHHGHWLVRIEDVDQPRSLPGADTTILQQLAACGLFPDEAPVWQSQRTAHYQRALDQLVSHHQAYACACSRKDIEEALHTLGRDKSRHGELVYPGTCRDGLNGKAGRAWRFRTSAHGNGNRDTSVTHDTDTTAFHAEGPVTHWTDRRLGAQAQDVGAEVGDFVLKRADGLFAYQLAVVVDDAAQGITHIVRGADLADNTARQILLQRALGYPTPQYMHTPLVLAADGQKLSKQNGAQALDTGTPEAALAALNQAARVLGLQPRGTGDNRGTALAAWIEEWRATLQPQNP
jgi:glutamyl-Q tRNA(Asp) synthetase